VIKRRPLIKQCFGHAIDGAIAMPSASSAASLPLDSPLSLLTLASGIEPLRSRIPFSGAETHGRSTELEGFVSVP